MGGSLTVVARRERLREPVRERAPSRRERPIVVLQRRVLRARVRVPEDDNSQRRIRRRGFRGRGRGARGDASPSKKTPTMKRRRGRRGGAARRRRRRRRRTREARARRGRADARRRRGRHRSRVRAGARRARGDLSFLARRRRRKRREVVGRGQLSDAREAKIFSGGAIEAFARKRRREGSGRVRNHGVGVDERSVDRDWILGLAEFAVSCGHRKAKSEDASFIHCCIAPGRGALSPLSPHPNHPRYGLLQPPPPRHQADRVRRVQGPGSDRDRGWSSRLRPRANAIARAPTRHAHVPGRYTGPHTTAFAW